MELCATGDHNEWAGEPLNEQCLERNRGTHEVSKRVSVPCYSKRVCVPCYRLYVVHSTAVLHRDGDGTQQPEGTSWLPPSPCTHLSNSSWHRNRPTHTHRVTHTQSHTQTHTHTVTHTHVHTHTVTHTQSHTQSHTHTHTHTLSHTHTVTTY